MADDSMRNQLCSNKSTPHRQDSECKSTAFSLFLHGTVIHFIGPGTEPLFVAAHLCVDQYKINLHLFQAGRSSLELALGVDDIPELVHGGQADVRDLFSLVPLCVVLSRSFDDPPLPPGRQLPVQAVSHPLQEPPPPGVPRPELMWQGYAEDVLVAGLIGVGGQLPELVRQLLQQFPLDLLQRLLVLNGFLDGLALCSVLCLYFLPPSQHKMDQSLKPYNR